MSLKDFVPSWYESIKEFDVLFEVEDELIQEVDEHLKKIKNNQWIQTADEQMIYFHEQLLGILVNPETEDLEFRKQRILNRLQSTPPFTLSYLKDHLNRIFGKENYLLIVNYDDYQMVLETAAENANWFLEAQKIIHKVKPANIIYIQRPTYLQEIVLVETAAIAPLTYFRLGRSRVGKDQLLRRSEESEVIMQ